MWRLGGMSVNQLTMVGWNLFDSSPRKQKLKTIILAKITTAGLPISETHTNNQFADEPEEIRQFRDHRWKALGEKNSDLSGLFFCDRFLTFYF